MTEWSIEGRGGVVMLLCGMSVVGVGVCTVASSITLATTTLLPKKNLLQSYSCWCLYCMVDKINCSKWLTFIDFMQEVSPWLYFYVTFYCLYAAV